MQTRAAVCLVASAIFGLVACQRGRPRAFGTAPEPAASTALAAERTQVAEARALVRTEISRQWSLPKNLAEQHCPDAQLRSLPTDQRELALAVADSRYEGRSVLPLEVLRHLVDPDPNRLESELIGIDHDVSSDAAIASIRWLAALRYVAVFHILDYAGARRFHRVGHRHAEWSAGRILGVLVVHDAKSGASVCQTRFAILGDAHGAPLALRLRSGTRRQLTEQLGKRLREAARPALARLSSVLYLRGDPRAARLALR